MKKLRTALAFLLALAMLAACLPAAAAADPVELGAQYFAAPDDLAARVEADLQDYVAQTGTKDAAPAQKLVTKSYLIPYVTTVDQSVVQGGSATLRFLSYNAERKYTQWIFIYPGDYANSGGKKPLVVKSLTNLYGATTQIYKWTATDKFTPGDYCVVTCVTDPSSSKPTEIDRDSIYYANLHVMKEAAPLQALTLSHNDDDLTPIGDQELTLEAGGELDIVPRFKPYNTTADRVVTYTTSNPNAVRVDDGAGGIATVNALSAGSAVVTAKCGTQTATLKLRVIPVVQSVTVSPASKSLCNGTTAQLTAAVTPAEAGAVTWTTSDPDIATVDANGLVTGVSEGAVTITAACGSKSATATVQVRRHVFRGVTIKVPATATQPGSETGTCSFCKQENAVNILPAVFSDTNGKSWYAESVDYVYAEGLMNGTSDSTFAPDAGLNRAMVVTILYRMAGSPKVTSSASFRDVPANTWYTDAVAWGASKGVVTGYADQTFRPTTNVTREQIATMLYRYAKLSGSVSGGASLTDFPDGGKVSNYAKEAVSWAVAQGYIKGVAAAGSTKPRLEPQGTATRAQFATIAARYLQA